MDRRKQLAFVSGRISHTDCKKYQDHFEKTFSITTVREPDYPTLFSRLVDPDYHLDFLLIDIDEILDSKDFNLYEFIDTIRTLISCSMTYEHSGPDTPDQPPGLVSRRTQIVAMVGLDTPIDVIRQVQKISAVAALALRLGPGITYHDVDAAAENFIQGNNIVPPKIAARLRGGRRSRSTGASITLTPRQTQILDLVTTRGASNKSIAKTLKISESTVKLHVSAILKKYGCRNRTQLAVFGWDKDKTPA